MNQDWIYGLIGGFFIGAASLMLLVFNGRIAGSYIIDYFGPKNNYICSRYGYWDVFTFMV